MNQHLDLHPDAIPTGWSYQGHHARKPLWVGILAGLAAYRERSAAAMLYAKLSNLSNAELERRGLARGDLHWQISQTLHRR
jgi:hypothetical protein